MSLPYKIREELKEECKKKHSDVHTVHIGICGHHYFIISEVFYIILYVKCGLEEVKLFVFIDNLFRETV